MSDSVDDFAGENELNNLEGEADSIEGGDSPHSCGVDEETAAADENNDIHTPEGEGDATVADDGAADVLPAETNSQPIDEQQHGDYYAKLVGQGVAKFTAAALEKLVNDGLIAESDLDERALDGLKEFQSDHVMEVLAEFSGSNLSHVSNKSAYLCGVMKTFRQRLKSMKATGVHAHGPDEAKLKAILERTNYSMDVTTGQRKYGGPPPDWEGPAPGAGHEVFCGKIPKEVFEDELIPVFEKCGKMWDLRLMMDPLTGFNRGYAFITFCDKEAAHSAVKQLDNYEIRPGKKLKVNVSVANVRLFVGNIPKSKSREDIKEEFLKQAEGLVDVIVYTSPDDPNKKNRGFAFLEYESHKAASMAKRKLGSGRVRVWNCDIIVDWADPQEEPDEETMSKVKVLYVRNLTQDVTEEMLKEKFEPYGAVERVKKVKDYGFIHFAEREHAMQALNDLNGQKLGAATMEISLAKPQTDKQKKPRQRNDGNQGSNRGMDFGWASSRGGRGRGRNASGQGGYGGNDGGYSDFGMGSFGSTDSYDYSVGYDDFGMQNRGRVQQFGLSVRGSRPQQLLPSRGSFGSGTGFRGGRGILAAAPREFMLNKRKAEMGLMQQQVPVPKRRNTGQGLGILPIPQQPLGSGDFRRGGEQWYQDSFGEGW